MRRDDVEGEEICEYNVRASGTEEVLVEYTEQNYRAQVNLTDVGGRVLARLGYDTKGFDRRTLQTLYSCDAEDNVFDKRSDVRRELRRANPVDRPEPGRPRRPRGN